MALQPCRECGHQVSTEAPTCPQCGAKDPTGEFAEVGEKKGCFMPAFGLLLAIFVIGALITNPSKDEKPSAPKSSTCKDDWKLCADNGELVNNWSGWSLVQSECKRTANDSAKYGTPEWPWFAFGTFTVGDSYTKNGVGVAIENEAKFSNGFGAMTHVSVTCFYDLNNKKVTDVRVSPK